MSRAEITVSVMNDLKETEERDVDFLLGQLADCLRDSDRRNAVKSFRRQMLVVAADDRIEEGREEIVFGFAFEDGSNFEASDHQSARKRMYGFNP